MVPDDPNNKYFLRSYLRYGWIHRESPGANVTLDTTLRGRKTKFLRKGQTKVRDLFLKHMLSI